MKIPIKYEILSLIIYEYNPIEIFPKKTNLINLISKKK